jgi:excisionase family DNA binding protein
MSQKNTPEGPILLTVKEVSTVLRVQRPKVYELIKDGAIDGFKVGADWRIRRDSVEKLIGPIPEEFFNETLEDGDEEGTQQNSGYGQSRAKSSLMPS